MKKIVIANWKMKLGLTESVNLAKEYKEKFKDFDLGEVVICPDFVSLNEVGKTINGSSVSLGAQNVFWEDKGAYTGEVSARTLKEVGCRYVLIGHSERRQYLQENYEMIHKKIKEVLNQEGIVPVVCIGETAEERKTDKRDYVILEQLHQALSGIDIMGDQQIIVAYEPSWAIGTGTAIEPSEAEYAHKIIHLALGDLFDNRIVEKNIRIIYGASVSSKIVKDFAKLDNMHGLLVGTASLDSEEFYKIAQAIVE